MRMVRHSIERDSPAYVMEARARAAASDRGGPDPGVRS